MMRNLIGIAAIVVAPSLVMAQDSVLNFKIVGPPTRAKSKSLAPQLNFQMLGAAPKEDATGEIRVFRDKTCRHCAFLERDKGLIEQHGFVFNDPNRGGKQVQYVYVEENPELHKKYGIKSFPTAIAFRNGKPVKDRKLIGYERGFGELDFNWLWSGRLPTGEFSKKPPSELATPQEKQQRWNQYIQQQEAMQRRQIQTRRQQQASNR